MTAFYVNDRLHDEEFLKRNFAQFEALPHLKNPKGVRYAICVQDAAHWIALYLYLKDRGASIAPLHPATPPEAARRIAKSTDSHRLLFGDAQTVDPIDESGPDKPGVLVQQSSGTTGEPKTVVRSFASVDREIESYNVALGDIAQATPLVACPVSHSYGLISGVLAAFARNQTPVIITNVNPKYAIKQALDSNTLLYASPALLGVLARLLTPEQKLGYIMTSGATLPTPTLHTLLEKSRGVLQQYGCSEVGCISLARQVDAVDNIGSPLAHLKVSAGTSASDPQEIVVQDGHRTISTRDLGYFENAHLRFVSRIDETIIVAGVNVYPSEVENVLATFPDITDVVAYAKSDPFAGERICVQFTARSEINVSTLRSWCAEQLSPFQLPSELLQVQQLPREANGKINRRRLRGEQQENAEPAETASESRLTQSAE